MTSHTQSSPQVLSPSSNSTSNSASVQCGGPGNVAAVQQPTENSANNLQQPTNSNPSTATNSHHAAAIIAAVTIPENKENAPASSVSREGSSVSSHPTSSPGSLVTNNSGVVTTQGGGALHTTATPDANRVKNPVRKSSETVTTANEVNSAVVIEVPKEEKEESVSHQADDNDANTLQPSQNKQAKKMRGVYTQYDAFQYASWFYEQTLHLAQQPPGFFPAQGNFPSGGVPQPMATTNTMSGYFDPAQQFTNQPGMMYYPQQNPSEPTATYPNGEEFSTPKQAPPQPQFPNSPSGGTTPQAQGLSSQHKNNKSHSAEENISPSKSEQAVEGEDDASLEDVNSSNTVHNNSCVPQSNSAVDLSMNVSHSSVEVSPNPVHYPQHPYSNNNRPQVHYQAAPYYSGGNSGPQVLGNNNIVGAGGMGYFQPATTALPVNTSSSPPPTSSADGTQQPVRRGASQTQQQPPPYSELVMAPIPPNYAVFASTYVPSQQHKTPMKAGATANLPAASHHQSPQQHLRSPFFQQSKNPASGSNSPAAAQGVSTNINPTMMRSYNDGSSTIPPTSAAMMMLYYQNSPPPNQNFTASCSATTGFSHQPEYDGGKDNIEERQHHHDPHTNMFTNTTAVAPPWSSSSPAHIAAAAMLTPPSLLRSVEKRSTSTSPGAPLFRITDSRDELSNIDSEEEDDEGSVEGEGYGQKTHPEDRRRLRNHHQNKSSKVAQQQVVEEEKSSLHHQRQQQNDKMMIIKSSSAQTAAKKYDDGAELIFDDETSKSSVEEEFILEDEENVNNRHFGGEINRETKNVQQQEGQYRDPMNSNTLSPLKMHQSSNAAPTTSLEIINKKEAENVADDAGHDLFSGEMNDEEEEGEIVNESDTTESSHEAASGDIASLTPSTSNSEEEFVIEGSEALMQLQKQQQQKLTPSPSSHKQKTDSVCTSDTTQSFDVATITPLTPHPQLDENNNHINNTCSSNVMTTTNTSSSTLPSDETSSVFQQSKNQSTEKLIKGSTTAVDRSSIGVNGSTETHLPMPRNDTAPYIDEDATIAHEKPVFPSHPATSSNTCATNKSTPPAQDANRDIAGSKKSLDQQNHQESSSKQHTPLVTASTDTAEPVSVSATELWVKSDPLSIHQQPDEENEFLGEPRRYASFSKELVQFTEKELTLTEADRQSREDLIKKIRFLASSSIATAIHSNSKSGESNASSSSPTLRSPTTGDTKQLQPSSSGEGFAQNSSQLPPVTESVSPNVLLSSCNIKVHGSYATGVALASSDIDFTVMDYAPLVPREALELVGYAIANCTSESILEGLNNNQPSLMATTGEEKGQQQKDPVACGEAKGEEQLEIHQHQRTDSCQSIGEQEEQNREASANNVCVGETSKVEEAGQTTTAATAFKSSALKVHSPIVPQGGTFAAANKDVDTLSSAPSTPGESNLSPLLTGPSGNSAIHLSGELFDVIIVPYTRVPVVKLTEKKTALRGDISFGGGESEASMQLTQALLEKHPHARPVLLLLKYLTKECGIGETKRGGVTSFLLTLLLLHFFQVKSGKPLLYHGEAPQSEGGKDAQEQGTTNAEEKFEGDVPHQNENVEEAEIGKVSEQETEGKEEEQEPAESRLIAEGTQTTLLGTSDNSTLSEEQREERDLKQRAPHSKPPLPPATNNEPQKGKTVSSNSDDIVDSGIFNNKQSLGGGAEPLGQLVIEFFSYYGEVFDFANGGLSFDADGTSHIVPKSIIAQKRGQAWHITSPFDPSYDVTARMSLTRELQNLFWRCFVELAAKDTSLTTLLSIVAAHGGQIPDGYIPKIGGGSNHGFPPSSAQANGSDFLFPASSQEQQQLLMNAALSSQHMMGGNPYAMQMMVADYAMLENNNNTNNGNGSGTFQSSQTNTGGNANHPNSVPSLDGNGSHNNMYMGGPMFYPPTQSAVGMGLPWVTDAYGNMYALPMNMDGTPHPSSTAPGAVEGGKDGSSSIGTMTPPMLFPAPSPSCYPNVPATQGGSTGGMKNNAMMSSSSPQPPVQRYLSMLPKDSATGGGGSSSANTSPLATSTGGKGTNTETTGNIGGKANHAMASGPIQQQPMAGGYYVSTNSAGQPVFILAGGPLPQQQQYMAHPGYYGGYEQQSSGQPMMVDHSTSMRSYRNNAGKKSKQHHPPMAGHYSDHQPGNQQQPPSHVRSNGGESSGSGTGSHGGGGGGGSSRRKNYQHHQQSGAPPQYTAAASSSVSSPSYYAGGGGGNRPRYAGEGSSDADMSNNVPSVVHHRYVQHPQPTTRGGNKAGATYHPPMTSTNTSNAAAAWKNHTSTLPFRDPQQDGDGRHHHHHHHPHQSIETFNNSRFYQYNNNNQQQQQYPYHHHPREGGGGGGDVTVNFGGGANTGIMNRNKGHGRGGRGGRHGSRNASSGEDSSSRGAG